MNRPLLACVLAFILIVLPASETSADFTPATLVSGTQLIPFEKAGSPTFSQNGRYVALQGTLAGEPGIYRRDLQTGAVKLVAGVKLSAGASEEVSPVPALDASAPSISADGRYVAFTATAVLDPAAKPGAGCPQVYVRSMEEPLSAPGAYELASALDGTEEGIAYASCPASGASSLAVAGAQAAPGVALSADGRHVVFTILSPSDLTGPCKTTPTVECPTDPSQVALRSLDTKTTTLVSTTPSGEATPGGGAFPSSASEQKGVPSMEAAAGSSAAISADGSTVAWLGTNIPFQVPPGTDVIEGMARLGAPVGTEVEPLWRRVADGLTAGTRRLLNDAGINFYFTESSEEAEAVNAGTLYRARRDFVPPVLNSDGTTVAAIANGPTAANEGSYRYVTAANAPVPAEAYVIYVSDVPATPPRVIALTATPSFAASNALVAGVSDVAISPDGSRVSFNTRRTSFALAPPTLIGPPAPEGGSAYTYEANMALGTLQRVTSTYDGSPPNGDPGLISFSGDGQSLVFASSASNLFYGDGTPGASQVYVVHENSAASQVAGQSIEPVPVTPLPVPAWVLSATAHPQPDGSVLLDAQVPGAGRLGARATAQLPISTGRSVRLPRRGRARKAASATAARSRRKITTSAGVEIPARTVALTGTVAAGPSELQLRVRATARYRTLLAGRHGLYAQLRVTFAAKGHKTLIQEIPVTFRARAHKRTKG
jgi:Tol biopolymer transport system component